MSLAVDLDSTTSVTSISLLFEHRRTSKTVNGKDRERIQNSGSYHRERNVAEVDRNMRICGQFVNTDETRFLCDQMGSNQLSKVNDLYSMMLDLNPAYRL